MAAQMDMCETQKSPGHLKCALCLFLHVSHVLCHKHAGLVLVPQGTGTPATSVYLRFMSFRHGTCTATHALPSPHSGCICTAVTASLATRMHSLVYVSITLIAWHAPTGYPLLSCICKYTMTIQSLFSLSLSLPLPPSLSLSLPLSLSLSLSHTHTHTHTLSDT